MSLMLADKESVRSAEEVQKQAVVYQEGMAKRQKIKQGFIENKSKKQTARKTQVQKEQDAATDWNFKTRKHEITLRREQLNLLRCEAQNLRAQADTLDAKRIVGLAEIEAQSDALEGEVHQENMRRSQRDYENDQTALEQKAQAEWDAVPMQ